MRKICIFTANRADFSRLETILESVNKHPDLELQLVVLGAHLMEKTGMTIEEIKRKGFKIDHKIYVEIEGGNPVTMSKSVGLAIMELTTALDQLRPDIAIVPVDRFESLAMGIAPALMNIHVAHIQGGEVTGTIDESIRHALTKLSHIHFVATEKSRERVIKMGELPDSVFNVGCPGTDLLLRTPIWSMGDTINKLNKEARGGNKELDSNKPYLLVIQHPVTTEFNDAAEQITETLEALRSFNGQIIILWPNIDAGANETSRVLREYAALPEYSSKIEIIKHIPSEAFINILRHGLCLIGNSSAGIREACYFGTPVVNVGSRQDGRERGSNIMDVSYNREEIARAIEHQLDHGKYPVEYIYGDGTAGKKIADILATIKLPNIQKKITY